jgi:DNA-binding NarL/FixJ family response regulator
MARSVLVVDDHRRFRAEARQLLEDDGFDVVGEAEDAAGALREAARLQPDLVLLDIGLPDGSGLEAVASLRSVSPGSLVVLVSGRRADEYGDRVARSGADAFVEKMALSPGVIAGLVSDRRVG